MQTIQHNGLQCASCNDIIYSRTNNDWRRCSCKKCYVSGGFDFCRFGGHGHHVFIELKGQSPIETLWTDWHDRLNKYGLIKNCKEEKIRINIG